MKPRKILCASHGTVGARAAESSALAFCGPHTELHLLTIVPDFWKGMMGDDWLNNGVTRDRYGKYLEDQLEDETIAVVTRMAEEAEQRGASFSNETKLGKPTNCLVESSRQNTFDLIVVGSPRPAGVEGLRSRLDLNVLIRNTNIPLLIAPYPTA